MKTASVLAMVCLASLSQCQTYLNIGDPAPSLSHITWLKGNPAGKAGAGKVYVVEFWATWCGPCKEGIPHLTQLARKFDGQAAVMGIDIWETSDKRDTGYMDRVSAFVKKEGSQMDYIVGADDMHSDIGTTWMKAAGEGGIPESFVIGKDGRIAWMGNPSGLDEVLPQVIAGTFDVTAARKRRSMDVELIRPVKEAMEGGKYAEAVRLIDSLTAKHPEMSRFYQYDRYAAYTHLDLAKTKEMTQSLLEETNHDIGIYQMMSSVFATEKGLSRPAYEFGLSLIEQALAKKDRQYLFMSMGAAVSLKLNRHDDAIKYDREAVADGETDVHCPKPFLQFLKRNLQDVENAKH